MPRVGSPHYCLSVSDKDGMSVSAGFGWILTDPLISDHRAYIHTCRRAGMWATGREVGRVDAGPAQGEIGEGAGDDGDPGTPCPGHACTSLSARGLLFSRRSTRGSGNDRTRAEVPSMRGWAVMVAGLSMVAAIVVVEICHTATDVVKRWSARMSRTICYLRAAGQDTGCNHTMGLISMRL